MDIEFSEWGVFDKLLCDTLSPGCRELPSDLILVELHFRNAAEVVSFFERMAQHGYGIFQREPNPIGYPLATEFAFAKVLKGGRRVARPENGTMVHGGIG